MASAAVISQESCSMEQEDSPVSICHFLWRIAGKTDVWNRIPLLPWVPGTELWFVVRLSWRCLYGAIFPSAPGPSLTGSFYLYSLNVSHLTSFPFTLTHDMKQTVRPTPSAQSLVPAVPEKAFIHSLRWDRQTYSL